MTETSADLMINGTNKIFFYLFLESQYQEGAPIDKEILNVTNALLRAYDLSTNNTVIRDQLKGINSVYNGLGFFSYTHKQNFLPFLELSFPQNNNSISDITEVPKISQTEVLEGELSGPQYFPNGTVRIPIKIAGIQTRRAKLQRRQEMNNNPDVFYYDQLKDFNFTHIDNETGIEYTYSEGFFTVRVSGH